jgi:hypothetical protein
MRRAKEESSGFACNSIFKQLHGCIVKRPKEWVEKILDQAISYHAMVIPCDGGVTIPLCARLRSVALFRLLLLVSGAPVVWSPGSVCAGILPSWLDPEGLAYLALMILG